MDERLTYRDEDGTPCIRSTEWDTFRQAWFRADIVGGPIAEALADCEDLADQVGGFTEMVKLVQAQAGSRILPEGFQCVDSHFFNDVLIFKPYGKRVSVKHDNMGDVCSREEEVAAFLEGLPAEMTFDALRDLVKAQAEGRVLPDASMIINMIRVWDCICEKYHRQEGLMDELCNDCPLHVSEEFGCQTAMHEDTEKFAQAWEAANTAPRQTP